MNRKQEEITIARQLLLKKKEVHLRAMNAGSSNCSLAAEIRALTLYIAYLEGVMSNWQQLYVPCADIKKCNSIKQEETDGQQTRPESE